MNPVATASAPHPVRADTPPAGASGPPTAPFDALPNPSTPSAAGLNDAMSMLYSLLAKDGQVQVESRKHEIDGHRVERQKALDDQKAAHERQRKADGDGSTGFFGSIGKLVSDEVDDVTHLRVSDVVSDFKDDCAAAWNSPRFWQDLESGAGSIAKAFNTAMALTTAVLAFQYDDAADIVKNPDSASARHYGLVGRSMLIVGAGVATAITAGTATPVLIAAASVSLSAGGEAVAETKCLGDASGYVGIGMDVAGTAVTLGFANTSDAQKIVNALRGAAMIVEGAGKVVEGVAHARSAVFQGEADDARADATAAKQRMDRLDRLIKHVLGETKDVQKSHERALDSLRGAMETNNQTLLAAAGMRG